MPYAMCIVRKRERERERKRERERERVTVMDRERERERRGRDLSQPWQVVLLLVQHPQSHQVGGQPQLFASTPSCGNNFN